MVERNGDFFLIDAGAVRLFNSKSGCGAYLEAIISVLPPMDASARAGG
jgi:hypothetical protein